MSVTGFSTVYVYFLSEKYKKNIFFRKFKLFPVEKMKKNETVLLFFVKNRSLPFAHRILQSDPLDPRPDFSDPAGHFSDRIAAEKKAS